MKQERKTVMSASTANEFIVETPRGLSVAGTRITLYDVLDYVRDGWPASRIAAWLNLSAEQVQAALDYIDAHRPEVERQYAQVLRQAEENRRYWEERNRGRLGQPGARASTADTEEIIDRIRQRKERLGQ